jgi:hypothetical protein
LGYLEDASGSYSCCLNNSSTGSDHKMFAEASSGLERVKVTCPVLPRAFYIFYNLIFSVVWNL